MAYSVPSTRATGYVVTAANWNADLVDNVTWLGRDAPHARVYNSANISHTTSGSFQALTFNSERYDTGACHSTVSNTGRLTVPTGGDGIYRIAGIVSFASNATGYRALKVRVNNTTDIIYAQCPAVSGSGTVLNISGDYLLAAADYIELLGFQNSGGALNMEVVANWSPEFMFEWVKLS